MLNSKLLCKCMKINIELKKNIKTLLNIKIDCFHTLLRQFENDVYCINQIFVNSACLILLTWCAFQWKSMFVNIQVFISCLVKYIHNEFTVLYLYIHLVNKTITPNTRGVVFPEIAVDRIQCRSYLASWNVAKFIKRINLNLK